MTSPWSLGADRRYLEAVSNLPEAGSYDHEAQSNYLEADSNLNPNNYQAQGSYSVVLGSNLQAHVSYFVG